MRGFLHFPGQNMHQAARKRMLKNGRRGDPAAKGDKARRAGEPVTLYSAGQKGGRFNGQAASL